MKGVLYMVVKKKEFYCNLGVQTGYAEIKPVLKAVRMPDGTVSSFCQFTLAIPGERTSYTIFCVEELAQQCAESVTPGDYAIAYGLHVKETVPVYAWRRSLFWMEDLRWT